MFFLKKNDPANIKVRVMDLVMFTRQFVCMMNAGLPLLRALDFYASADPGKMGKVIDGVSATVREGGTLSKGMSRYPRVFSPLFLGLVRSGEGNGELDRMLQKITDILERQFNLQNKVKAALTYPVLVMVVAFCVFLAFIFVILPALEPMLTSVNVAPPWPTQVLIMMGAIIRSPVIVGGSFLLAGVAAFFGPTAWKRLRELESRRIIIDRIPLELPLVGLLLRRLLISRVLFALSNTVDSGLSLTNSLHLARGVSDNAYISAEMLKVHDSICDGGSLAEGLGMTSLFMKGTVQMVAVGEETSSLSSSLMFVAKLYDEMAEDSVNNFAALMEPVLMAMMGVVAGFMILATILPIVKMLQAL